MPDPGVHDQRALDQRRRARGASRSLKGHSAAAVAPASSARPRRRRGLVRRVDSPPRVTQSGRTIVGGASGQRCGQTAAVAYFRVRRFGLASASAAGSTTGSVAEQRRRCFHGSGCGRRRSVGAVEWRRGAAAGRNRHVGCGRGAARSRHVPVWVAISFDGDVVLFPVDQADDVSELLRRASHRVMG